MVPTEVQQIVDFVEGRLDPKLFERFLYENPRFEEVLNNDPNLPANTYVGRDVYLYIIQQNFNSPGGVLNAHATLKQFLERNSFSCEPTKSYDRLYDLILSSQPKWLDIDIAYIQREIMPGAGSLSGSGLKKWLRAEFLKRFQYVTKPPRSIQSACWPINDNDPLVFLGQLPIKNYLHELFT